VDKKGKCKAVEIDPETQELAPTNEQWHSYLPNLTPEDWDRHNKELLEAYYKEAVPNPLLTTYQQVYEDISGPTKIIQQHEQTEDC
jgi:hypothetical protein